MAWSDPVSGSTIYFPWEDGSAGGTPLNSLDLDTMEKNGSAILKAGLDSLAAYVDSQDAGQSAALDAYVQHQIVGLATLLSPTFTGTPRAPTPIATVSDTTVATMAAVHAVVQAAFGSTGIPGNTSVPVISGVIVVGSTVTCSTGAWSNGPTGYQYQLQKASSPTGVFANITGDVSNTHMFATADVGFSFRWAVTASNAQGASALPAYSAATILVGPALTLSSVVASVSGTTATVVVTSSADIENVALFSHGTQVKAAADDTPSGGVATFTVVGLANGSYSFDAVGFTVAAGQPGGQTTPTVASNTITVTNPSITTLRDPFSAAALNSAWALDSGAALTISGDAGTIPVNTGYLGITTTGRYDLTGQAFICNVVRPTGDGHGEAMICLTDSLGGTLEWEISPGGALPSTLTDAAGNAQTAGTSVTTADVWYRIRESGGTLYWDHAPDAGGNPGTWSNAQSKTLAQTGLASVTGLQARLRSGTYGAAGSSSSVFSNVNLGGSTPAAAPPMLIGSYISNVTTAKAAVMLNGTNVPAVRLDYDQFGATAAAAMISYLQSRSPKVGVDLLFVDYSISPSTVASFCAAQPAGSIVSVEVGNEDIYRFKTSDANLSSVASALATATKAIHTALAGTGIKVLCQADNGGGNGAAVGDMYAAVPNLHNYCDGWVAHPYGVAGSTSDPNGTLSRVTSQTVAQGAPSNFPIYCTEYGISSDDGNTLVATFDGVTNYGRSLTETYAQAAAALPITINSLKSSYPQIAAFYIFSDIDEQPHGTNTAQDDHFGICYTSVANGTPILKPSYATAVASLVAAN